MATRNLTSQRAHELFSYDELTGLFTSRIWRGNRKKGAQVGTLRQHGYLSVNVGGKHYYLHRIAWLMTYGEWPVEVIDHINGIPSDNRLVNLRAVSQSENMQNLKRPLSNNRSGFLGVCFFKPAKLWKAEIGVGGVKIHLGYFKTAELAANAYIERKKLIHSTGKA